MKGVLEIQTLFFHDEFKNVAPIITFAKTTPGTGLGPDYESRGAYVGMKGAEAGLCAPAAAQFYPGFGGEVDDVYPGFDFID